jgi:hypothetical protein
VKVATTSFDAYIARIGKYFWIGSRPDKSQNASGAFSDVAVDPVYIDGTDVVIGDYYYGPTEDEIRPDWNSARAVLAPGQNRSDMVKGNLVDLDAQFWESR